MTWGSDRCVLQRRVQRKPTDTNKGTIYRNWKLELRTKRDQSQERWEALLGEGKVCRAWTLRGDWKRELEKLQLDTKLVKGRS